MIDALLEDIEVRIGVNYNLHRKEFEGIAEMVVYTGTIDESFNYRFGVLEYRGLSFETECLETANYQGAAVINFTGKETPCTRIIEHKRFEFGNQPYTSGNREKMRITRLSIYKWKEHKPFGKAKRFCYNY